MIMQSLAQTNRPMHAADIQLQMEKLNTLGSVLYFAAHPDDENTKLIAYLASERKVRTAYLSLTRGDGGQNLIGTEQGVELGLIRTQELLQARKIDRGEQYFTSAYDFGFSKTHQETFRFWNEQEVLREAVWIIRKLQPDVIITRFPPDERGGHGHHQASAMLARKAFDAAADPNAFPEQLVEVKPWQAKRLIWNTANFMRMQGDSPNQLKIDIGQFNPLLGHSYGELSALSRSQHKSQGFGSAATNGQTIESFEHVAGAVAKQDLFDQIDISWTRIHGGRPVQQAIDRLVETYNPTNPAEAIPQLAQIWHLIQKLDNTYWRERKTKEVESLLLACAGMKVEALVEKPYYTQGESIPFRAEIIVRNPNTQVCISYINGQNIQQTLVGNSVTKFNGQLAQPTNTQPYWLAKPHTLGKFEVPPANFGFPMNPDLPAVNIVLEVGGIEIPLVEPLQYKYLDPVRGDVHEYVQVRPAIAVDLDQPFILAQKGERKKVTVTFLNQANLEGQKTIEAQIEGAGWTISPAQIKLNFKADQPTLTQEFDLTNTSLQPEPSLLSFSIDGKPLKAVHEIAYTHIPTQTWFPEAKIRLQPIDIINPVKTVGYIMGAGDRVPEALRELGIQVDLIKTPDITPTLLSKYDAIVFGVRVMNIDKNIAQKMPLIDEYVKNGGVALLQYNVNSNLAEADFASRGFTISRARVTEEDAEVRFNDPKDPALNYPNKITKKDFDHWVQERGLYFAEKIAPRYRTPLSMNDSNEAPHSGSLLIERQGKGKFVYTSLSFFRQLPAGVAGANRLFVNLLAKEQ